MRRRFLRRRVDEEDDDDLPRRRRSDAIRVLSSSGVTSSDLCARRDEAESVSYE